MARLLVVVLVVVCYIACVSARGPPPPPPPPNPNPPPAHYYPTGPCQCDSNGRGRRWYSGPSGEGGYYLCYDCDPVLSPGEIAAIAVGSTVLLIVVITIIIAISCFCLGCNYDNGRPRGLRRWDSEDSVYVTSQDPQSVNPQFMQVNPLEPVYGPPAQPTIQVIKAPNFQPAVIQQQSPQVIQVPSTTATTPQITYLT